MKTCKICHEIKSEIQGNMRQKCDKCRILVRNQARMNNYFKHHTRKNTKRHTFEDCKLRSHRYAVKYYSKSKNRIKRTIRSYCYLFTVDIISDILHNKFSDYIIYKTIFYKNKNGEKNNDTRRSTSER